MRLVKSSLVSSLLLSALFFVSCSKTTVFNMSDFGLKAEPGFDNSRLLANALKEIAETSKPGKEIVINFDEGRYEFFPETADTTLYFISNHDQVKTRRTAFNFDGLKQVTLDGGNSSFIFHGRMLPMAVSACDGITLKNFSIDFENPHIAQATIVENDTINKSITYELAPWVSYSVKDSVLFTKGRGWEHTPGAGIPFEKDTKRILYQTGDIRMGVKGVVEVSPHLIKAPWDDARLVPGTVIVMRTWNRPSPGIFVQYSNDVSLDGVTVHYAEGMGLLAQMTANINLNNFNVALRGDDDPRYFTTQADATHFSGCKGVIISKNGLYENMMDDAINVHGTYLKVTKRVSEKIVNAKYMHSQAWGFDWGYPGDEVQFVKANTMDVLHEKTAIASIKPLDSKTNLGAKEFQIEFKDVIPQEINGTEAFGIENLEWTPEVVFSDNIVRNNRARGALFSTPLKTVAENNIFDHTSGTAILLCGDCNGWYETGSCTDVTIRNNKFINALTSYYQFTNAVISIYPEIPNLKAQENYFHGDKIVIEDNYFETFDSPILYAKSVNGITFRNNVIDTNTAYSPFHWNKAKFLFERVINYDIQDNDFEGGYDEAEDLIIK